MPADPAKIEIVPAAIQVGQELVDAAMKKVFHFDVPRENYQADAAIVMCFDSRFRPVFEQFFEQRGISQSDVIQIPGGAKSLASPEPESDREFLLQSIRRSIRLHQTRLVILTLHSDCGAYGGLAAFGGHAAAESQSQEADLRRAAECLRRAIPELEIEAYLGNFEGIWAVELGFEAGVA